MWFAVNPGEGLSTWQNSELCLAPSKLCQQLANATGRWCRSATSPTLWHRPSTRPRSCGWSMVPVTLSYFAERRTADADRRVSMRWLRHDQVLRHGVCAAGSAPTSAITLIPYSRSQPRGLSCDP